MTVKAADTTILGLEIFEAKPNPMFNEHQRRTVRFLEYSQAVPCAECGRRSKHHWSMLISFKAKTMAAIVLKESDKVHMPMTPVCRAHPLAPTGIALPGRTPKGVNHATARRPDA